VLRIPRNGIAGFYVPHTTLTAPRTKGNLWDFPPAVVPGARRIWNVDIDIADAVFMRFVVSSKGILD
jgi:hypothetical protein